MFSYGLIYSNTVTFLIVKKNIWPEHRSHCPLADFCFPPLPDFFLPMFQQNKGKRRTPVPSPALVKVTYQVKGGGHRFLSALLPSVIGVNFIITWPPSLAGVTAMLTSTETLLIGHDYQIITSLHYQGICQMLWSVSFRDYVSPHLCGVSAIVSPHRLLPLLLCIKHIGSIGCTSHTLQKQNANSSSAIFMWYGSQGFK